MQSRRDFPKAQAIFASTSRLKSQYIHSHLPNNESITAVEYAAVTIVATNVDSASVEEIIAKMLKYGQCT